MAAGSASNYGIPRSDAAPSAPSVIHRANASSTSRAVAGPDRTDEAPMPSELDDVEAECRARRQFVRQERRRHRAAAATPFSARLYRPDRQAQFHQADHGISACPAELHRRCAPSTPP